MHSRARRAPFALAALAFLLTAWVAAGDHPATASHETAPALGVIRDAAPAVQPLHDAVVVPLVATARAASSWSAVPGALAALVGLLALAGWGRLDRTRFRTVVAPRRYALPARRAPPTGSAA